MAITTLTGLAQGLAPQPTRIQDGPIPARSAGMFCVCRVSDATACISSSPTSEQTTL
jgi:hypothetical protein